MKHFINRLKAKTYLKAGGLTRMTTSPPLSGQEGESANEESGCLNSGVIRRRRARLMVYLDP
ncbi:hypothetical protein [Desulfonema magnum]|uniref:Uncharacterized protein n=1 Tax=Desulfonema magnum TaxID=45655 RepID=A0A975BFG5_9BACT|nr:hypothetical protein [Desulfonema magnum]QTA84219.1 Uncharacterized protein dnm_002130 [Desulfonema magnum]